MKYILESFGFNEQEIELYRTLLSLGDVPIADVTKAMKRHPQVVYRLLERLSSQGLVLTEVRHHRRYVRAEDPAVFLKTQEERVRILKTEVPALQALRSKPKEAAARISRGNDAVRMLRIHAFEELPKGSTYYILSASGTRFYEVLGGVLDRIEKRRIERGIQKRMLAFESQRLLLKREEQWGLTDLRYLPEKYDVPSSTNIFGDTVAIVIWSSDPIVITIESKEVAESYKNYFESLWRVAKK